GPRSYQWASRPARVATSAGSAVTVGNLEWLDKNKTSFLIMWRRPEEWGKLIYQWVSKNGLTNSVFTLYELASGDDTENEEFHGLDETMLLRALQALQQEHKAEIITLDDGRGVKFF
uniref:Vacuolar protein-sorting-associated protein 25 n=1 Tax=Bubo bubo TaxID=30461 RepID=A0A8C0IB73_BUBBB